MTKPKPEQTPAWREYWETPSAPHPDAGRAQNAVQRVQRPSPLGITGLYCHHYRAVDEHWHHTEGELEACMR